jgi:hypothetical protein
VGETCREVGNLQFCCNDPDISTLVVACPDGSQEGTAPGCVGFCCFAGDDPCPSCVNGVCSAQCCGGGRPCCNGVCCGDGEVCQEGVCMGCEPEKLCLLDTTCCAAEETCLAIGCCETERVCGTECCSGGEECVDGHCGLIVG